LQLLAAPHEWPHAPQFAESVAVSAQVFPHSVALFPHEQTPEMHDVPAPHAWPHAPQLSESVDVSTQVLTQFERPGPHAPSPMTTSYPESRSMPPSGEATESIHASTHAMSLALSVVPSEGMRAPHDGADSVIFWSRND
jgi:hypothetical protein